MDETIQRLSEALRRARDAKPNLPLGLMMENAVLRANSAFYIISDEDCVEALENYATYLEIES